MVVQAVKLFKWPTLDHCLRQKIFSENGLLWPSPWSYKMFTSQADCYVTQELHRIADNNKRNPDLVNHNLYKLLLEDDLIRLAHKNLTLAAGNHKVFYERKDLVRTVVKELHDEQYQFEGLSTPKEEGGGSTFFTGPPFCDRVVLEAMRILLDAIYEPIFLDTSHGYRPWRSRHTALSSIRKGVRDHNFALVGQVGGGQEVDQHVLVKRLEVKIGDKRFIRLVWKALKARYGDKGKQEWTIKSIWGGPPEVINLSALLTNIHLHALDCWIRDKKVKFNRGKLTVVIPELLSLSNRVRYLERKGKMARVKVLRKRRDQIVSQGWQDPEFREFFYVRYADEILLTFIASKGEVLTFQKELGSFLVNDMKVDNPGGIRLSYMRQSHALFLGTQISVKKSSIISETHRVSGRVRMDAPIDKIIAELASLRMVSQGGAQSHPVTFLSRCSHNEIVNYYNWVMRGCCTYYSFVDNFYQLTSFLRLAIRSSCVRTLTMKLKRFRSARTYKDFGTECAARYRVPVRNGQIVDESLSTDERSILVNRLKAAKRLKLEWEDLGIVEKGLLKRFVIPKRVHEANGDINLEFRGDYLLFCSKRSTHEETVQALRKLELLPPAQNLCDFKENLRPPCRPSLSIDRETWLSNP